MTPSRSVQLIYEASLITPQPLVRLPWYSFTLSFENARLTAPAFLIWFLSLAIHTYASKVTLHRGTAVHDLRHSPPLFDIIHDHTPSLQHYRIVPELCYLAPVLFTSALMLYHFDQRSLDCIRTFLWTHAFLLCFRALSFSSTLLPDSSQTCHTSIFTGSCYDLIYSGHVMIMLLSILLGQHFFVLHPIINAIFLVDLAVTSILVIVTRNHYTVDVVIALLMTPLTFIAFTRHPPLVSLACLVPEKVLAKESKVKTCLLCCGLGNSSRRVEKWRQRGGGGGEHATTTSSIASNNEINRETVATLRMGVDGYPLVSTHDFERLAEHAHSALKLMGVMQQQQHPRLIALYNNNQTTGSSEDKQRTQGSSSSSSASTITSREDLQHFIQNNESLMATLISTAARTSPTLLQRLNHVETANAETQTEEATKE